MRQPNSQPFFGHRNRRHCTRLKSYDPGNCGCGTPDTDSDNDSIPDCNDNCPAVANADQADVNGNGVGDLCELPTAGQSTNGCGEGMCASGMGMTMPMTLLGIGWMRRRRTRVRR